MSRDCQHFSPKKSYPMMHPNRGVCKGCKYGIENGSFWIWGKDCPLKEIKEQAEPGEIIENRDFVISYITKFVTDEDGGVIEQKIPVTVKIPHKAIYIKIGDGRGNYRWIFEKWEPLREPTKKEMGG